MEIVREVPQPTAAEQRRTLCEAYDRLAWMFGLTLTERQRDVLYEEGLNIYEFEHLLRSVDRLTLASIREVGHGKHQP